MLSGESNDKQEGRKIYLPGEIIFFDPFRALIHTLPLFIPMAPGMGATAAEKGGKGPRT